MSIMTGALAASAALLPSILHELQRSPALHLHGMQGVQELFMLAPCLASASGQACLHRGGACRLASPSLCACRHAAECYIPQEVQVPVRLGAPGHSEQTSIFHRGCHSKRPVRSIARSRHWLQVASKQVLSICKPAPSVCQMPVIASLPDLANMRSQLLRRVPQQQNASPGCDVLHRVAEQVAEQLGLDVHNMDSRGHLALISSLQEYTRTGGHTYAPWQHLRTAARALLATKPSALHCQSLTGKLACFRDAQPCCSRGKMIQNAAKLGQSSYACLASRRHP